MRSKGIPMDTMNITTFAKYPFIQEASRFVKEHEYSIEDIVSKPAYGRVRDRAKKRVLEAISGDSPKEDVSSQPEIELLSYPLARMLVSIVQDPYLLRRYGLWEAKRAYSFLVGEKDDVLVDIGKDFGVQARVEGKDFVTHFTDYLRYSASLKDLSWKLISRKMIKGMVYVPRDSYARLLEEAIREKTQANMSQVPESMAVPLAPYVEEIKAALNLLKGQMNLVVDGEVYRDAFPPCMNYLLSELQRGVNLPHTARFALTSFLFSIGYDKDQIMDLYRMAPDFREDLTRYQVEHITGGGGTEYTPPSCKTMTTYGNCYGKNQMCEWVNHPLNYYRKAASRLAKMGDKPVIKEAEKSTTSTQ